MDSMLLKMDQPPEPPIQQGRQQTHQMWKVVIRSLATVLAIAGIVFQVIVTTHRGEGEDDTPWASPESFVFVRLLV